MQAATSVPFSRTMVAFVVREVKLGSGCLEPYANQSSLRDSISVMSGCELALVLGWGSGVVKHTLTVCEENVKTCQW